MKVVGISGGFQNIRWPSVGNQVGLICAPTMNCVSTKGFNLGLPRFTNGNNFHGFGTSTALSGHRRFGDKSEGSMIQPHSPTRRLTVPKIGLARLHDKLSQPCLALTKSGFVPLPKARQEPNNVAVIFIPKVTRKSSDKLNRQ